MNNETETLRMMTATSTTTHPTTRNSTSMATYNLKKDVKQPCLDRPKRRRIRRRPSFMFIAEEEEEEAETHQEVPSSSAVDEVDAPFRQRQLMFTPSRMMSMIQIVLAVSTLIVIISSFVEGYLCINRRNVGGSSSTRTTFLTLPTHSHLTSSLTQQPSLTLLKVSSLDRVDVERRSKRRTKKQSEGNKKVLLVKNHQPTLKGNKQQPSKLKRKQTAQAAESFVLQNDDQHIPIILEEDIDSARIVVAADNSSKIEAVVVPANRSVPLRNDTLGESSILYKQQIEAQIKAIHELRAAAEAAAADVKEVATSNKKNEGRSEATAAQLYEAKEKFLQRVKMTSKIAPKRRKALRRVSRISATKDAKKKEVNNTDISHSSEPIVISKVEPVKQPPSQRQRDAAKMSSILSSKEDTKDTSQATTTTKKPSTISKKSSTMEGLTGGKQHHTKSRRGAKERQMTLYGTMGNVPDSLKDFVAKAHQIPRLTPSEERTLGHLTQTAIRLQQHRDDLRTKLGRRPTREEWFQECLRRNEPNIESEKDLLLKVKDGLRAKEKLVTSNLRMVQRVVNLYIRNGLGSEYSAADLMSEGTMALIRAAEKYDATKGFRFSTYAMYWIRSAVKRSQMSQSRLIGVPQRLVDTHKKLLPFVAQLKQTLGRPPTAKEVADIVSKEDPKITESIIERCWNAMDQRIYSLDAEITNRRKPNDESGKSNGRNVSGNGNAAGGKSSGMSSSSSRGGSETLYHIVDGSRGDLSEQERMEYTCWRDDLITSMRRYLSGDEVDLLLLRYGLVDPKLLPKGFDHGLPLTIREVSLLVGLKPDKVRRLLNNALRTLKTLMAHEWDPYYYQTQEAKKRRERQQQLEASLARQKHLEEQRNALLNSIAYEEQSRQQLLMVENNTRRLP